MDVLALAEEGTDDHDLIKCNKIETLPFNAATDTTDAEEEKSEETVFHIALNRISDIAPDTTAQSEVGLSVSEVFKQRLVNYRKKIGKLLNFTDQMDLRNPQLASEFASEIYHNM